jgi:hypothetical protein
MTQKSAVLDSSDIKKLGKITKIDIIQLSKGKSSFVYEQINRIVKLQPFIH